MAFETSPKGRFQRSLSGALSLYEMYVELRAVRGIGKRGKLDYENEDLLWLPRSSVVISMSALDTYVHAVLSDRIPHILRSHSVPEPLSKLMSSILPVKDARGFSELLPYLKSADPISVITERLKENTLAFLSFQAPDKVINAYELIGHGNIFQSISDIWQGPKSTDADIKKSLANYFKRRNQIAHEGDVDHLRNSRPITPKYAKDCHDFIEGLVGRMHRVVYGV
jgi:hypothetical protein